MTIQIELNPEMMERLAAEAEAQGIALEECVERLWREWIAGPQGQLSVAELHAMLDGIAKGSEKLPKVPTTAFTRETVYKDRRRKWAGTRYLIDSNILVRWVQPSDPDYPIAEFALEVSKEQSSATRLHVTKYC